MEQHLEIWHREKHDDFAVTKIYNTTVQRLIDKGGFYDSVSKAFILLHNINWIKVVEGE